VIITPSHHNHHNITTNRQDRNTAFQTINIMKRVIITWIQSLIQGCHHAQPSEKFVYVYSFLLSCVFVAALYVLVPPPVRRLDRDDELHIRWRTFASTVVSAGAIVTYPLLFCAPSSTSQVDDSWSMTHIFGFRHVRGVLLHTCILYLGPIVASIIRVYEYRQRLRRRDKQIKSWFLSDCFSTLLKPTLASFLNPLTEAERWRNIRNFVVAPITEEVVFRGCMVPALLATGMTPLKASLVAPLFFGVAHVHHGWIQIRQGQPLSRVTLVTTFQCAYTSLFGSYAAYAFIRTGSVGAVIVSHAFCNWMGLPDLSFLQKESPLHRYRTLLVAFFLTGTLAFKWAFSSDWLLPLPSVLERVSSTYE
jgi:prenyl protein peptidase